MCARFTLHKTKEKIQGRFHATFRYPYQPHHNATPSQYLAVILNDVPEDIVSLRWGLQPTWIKSVKQTGDIINVRMENLRDKKTFEKDLLQRRCLIIADGFYEWQKIDQYKQPYRITLTDESLFAFAGIWEENKFADGHTENTFAIITTEPNSIVKPIHNRMPVILSETEERTWLEQTDKNALLSILDSYPAKNMRAYPVDRPINNTENENSTLIQQLKNTRD